jgi:hypothetical protein
MHSPGILELKLLDFDLRRICTQMAESYTSRSGHRFVVGDVFPNGRYDAAYDNMVDHNLSEVTLLCVLLQHSLKRLAA